MSVHMGRWTCAACRDLALDGRRNGGAICRPSGVPSPGVTDITAGHGEPLKLRCLNMKRPRRSNTWAVIRAVVEGSGLILPRIGSLTCAELSTLWRLRYSPQSKQRPPRQGSNPRPWARRHNALATKTPRRMNCTFLKEHITLQKLSSRDRVARVILWKYSPSLFFGD